MATEEETPSSMEIGSDDPVCKKETELKVKTEVSDQSLTTKDGKTPSENSITFKTPSFVIPSKKRVQSNVDAFKIPNISVAKHTQSNEEEVKTEQKISTEQKDEKQSQKPTKPVAKVPSNMPTLSLAEQLKLSKTPFPYEEPSWGSICDKEYAFEVLKNGAIIDTFELQSKSFYVVGRLPSCDIPMEHPSLSRYHAVIQYADGTSEDYPRGWYLYDLDSTHGTWINKNRVPAEKYHQIHVDFVLKFGGSTRLFILQGPSDDRLEESELSVKEMVAQRDKQKKETDLLRQAEMDEAERKTEILKKREEDKGCAWGMDDDATEEDDEGSEVNPFAALGTENEELYVNDPKKSLNGYFEREGHEPPEYEFGEASNGKWKCSIELPIDDPSGAPIVAMVLVSGKKKDAVAACALEACKILDRHGELRKSTHESRKKKQKNWAEDDFYDSDEDVYLDRTGTIEKKREFRKSKVGKSDKVADTYDGLLEKHKNIVAEIEETEAKLEHAKAQAAAMENEEVDALEAYMSAIKSGMMDTKTKMKLKRTLLELKQEEQKVRKLVNIAKPASLPELKQKQENAGQPKASLLAGVGRMKGPTLHSKTVHKTTGAKKNKGDKITVKTEQFEVEEDEEEEERVSDENNLKQETETNSEIKQKIKLSEKSARTKSHEKWSKSDKDSSTVKDALSAPQSDTPEQKHSSASATKLKGPSMPLAAVLEKLQQEADAMDSDENETEMTEKEKYMKMKEASKRKSKGSNESAKKLKSEGDYDNRNPDYATWLPPQNQAGDGKTSLNAKYGY